MKRLELELLGRDDVDNGQPWKIFDARPERGSPSTIVEQREMRIPKGDNQLEECIRIHEMIHAKVSPTSNDFAGWLSRNVASEKALMLAEETRINYLAKLLGYPFEKSLYDKRERADAERFAAAGDWGNLVFGTVASIFTATENDWILGAKKHSPVYSKQLKTIVDLVRTYWLSFDNKFESKNVMQELSKIDFLSLSPKIKKNNKEIILKKRPAVDPLDEPAYKSPNIGFGYTEELAEMIDIFFNAAEFVSEADQDDDIFKSTIQTTITSSLYGTKERWDELRFSKHKPLQRVHGVITRKRTATNYGRNPRQISRLLTDPERRIFDKIRKVEGGIVLIDGSGSMRFTFEDIEQIVLASPGATIVVYSASDSPRNHNREHCPFNIFLLAKNGKMVSKTQLIDIINHLDGGNGVDLPVLQWALNARKNKKHFLVWVTDGFVHQIPSEVTKVVNLAVKSKVMFAENMPEALNLMGRLKKQRWIRTSLPKGMVEGVAATYGIKASEAMVNQRVAKKLPGSIQVGK